MSTLTFARFQRMNIARTKGKFHPGGELWPPELWALAIAGEAGELCNLLKKVVRGDFSLESRLADVLSECADIITYVDLLISVLGADTGDVVLAKFREVSERHGYLAPKSEVPQGQLLVGTDGGGNVVVNHPDLDVDESGCGHVVFSVDQARYLARLLQAKASEASAELDAKRMKDAEKIPVDRSRQELASGEPVPEDRSHAALKSNGQQKDYVVLSPAERARGFVRPVRRSYRHTKCGSVTSMSQAIAETYARDPSFYSGTFCVACGVHAPVGVDGEFVWIDDGTKVGS